MSWRAGSNKDAFHVVQVRFLAHFSLLFSECCVLIPTSFSNLYILLEQVWGAVIGMIYDIAWMLTKAKPDDEEEDDDEDDEDEDDDFDDDFEDDEEE